LEKAFAADAHFPPFADFAFEGSCFDDYDFSVSPRLARFLRLYFLILDFFSDGFFY